MALKFGVSSLCLNFDKVRDTAPLSIVVTVRYYLPNHRIGQLESKE